MKKIPIYLMPGLAAGPEIFENLTLDKEKYSLHYLSWLIPVSLDEEISDYAYRLSQKITEENPVLIGVSFGGILVQEMAQFITCRKIIIISSIKKKEELPKSFKLAKLTKIYKLFPTKVIENFEEYAKFFIGPSLTKKANLYKKYLHVRDKTYLKWSIANVLKWKQKETSLNIVHIQGTKDPIFPIKNIKDAIEIKNGTHVIILMKAKQISQIIDTILTC